MSGLLRKIGRSRVIKLADGRKQVTDRFEVRADAAIPATLDTLVFLADKDPHPKYTDCLLDTQQLLAGSPDQGAMQELVRVYYEPGPETARQIANTAKLIYPFHRDGDLTTAEIHQDYIVNTANYTPPALAVLYVGSPTPPTLPDALLTPQPTGDFYCLGDFDQTKIAGDSTRYTRVWSKIPLSRSIPFGTYPYRFPGLPTGTVGSSKSISAMTPDRGNVSVVSSPVFTSTAHGFTVGELIRLNINYDSFSGAGGTVRVTAVTTNTFTTTSFLLYVGPDGALDFGDFDPSGSTATAFAPARDPKVRPGSAIATYSYALAGVTAGITSSTDFRADPLFEPVVTATQYETDRLESTTTPTDTAYRAEVDAGGFLTAASAVTPYRGSAILERRSILVRAM